MSLSPNLDPPQGNLGRWGGGREGGREREREIKEREREIKERERDKKERERGFVI
jgi:hypothetical protein